MRGSGRTNDRLRTGPAVPGVLIQLVLPAVAAVAAWLIVPVIGWQIAVLGAAVLGMLVPQSLGGWLSIACLAVGMLLGAPSIAATMIAVLLVHVMHVLSSLLPLVPWRGRVLVRALLPSLRRLLLVQLVAQPVALGIMVVWVPIGPDIPGAALIGALCVAGFAAVLLLRLGRNEPNVRTPS